MITDRCDRLEKHCVGGGLTGSSSEEDGLRDWDFSPMLLKRTGRYPLSSLPVVEGGYYVGARGRGTATLDRHRVVGTA